MDLAKDIITALELELDMLFIGFQFGDICSHCRAAMPIEETYEYLTFPCRGPCGLFKQI